MPTPAADVLLADVNAFVYAHQPFGVSGLVLSSFLRLVTNDRVYRDPTPPPVALDFSRRVLAGPAAVSVRPGPSHWSLFVDTCRVVGARANVIPDAYLAALAIEHGATWLTTDRGFARFPGLRWRHPLDDG